MERVTVKELLENLTLIPPELRDSVVFTEEEGRPVCIGWPRIVRGTVDGKVTTLVILEGVCASDFNPWGTYYLPKSPPPPPPPDDNSSRITAILSTGPLSGRTSSTTTSSPPPAKPKKPKKPRG